MSGYCIEHATIVTVNRSRDVLEDAYLVIDGDAIVAVGAGACPQELKVGKDLLDATGKIIFPGMINTHNHLFQTLLKGLGDDRVLSQWLSTMTFPAATHLHYEDVLAAAMHGCVEGLHSGTTTMLDYMYAHPREGLSDAVVEAFKATGIRGILGRGMINDGMHVGVPQGIRQDLRTIERDCIRVYDAYHGCCNDRIRIWMAPAAIWSNSEDCLRLTWDLVKAHKGSGFTAHISETPFDREAARQLHGVPDAEVLEKLGILGPEVLMVHCVYLTDRDIRMAKHHGLRVSHNTLSNMYLSSGVAPVPQMIERGVVVGLGTDGPASNNSQDMVELLKATALLHKVHTTDPTVITAEKVLEMATIDGAKAIGQDDRIGSLEIGKQADLFIYNPLRSPKSIPMHNPVSTLVYSGSDACVETVFVDGVRVLEDGLTTLVDDYAVRRTCQETASRFAKAAGIPRSQSWRSIAF